MRALLVSTYELGHQPLQLAVAAAALVAAGHEVRCVDLAVDPLSEEEIDWPDVAAVSVPMHTATRLGLEVAGRLRRRRPQLPLCAFGLYAGAVGAPFDQAIAGEYEEALVEWVSAGGTGRGVRVDLGRRRRPLPARQLLPGLDRYVRLVHGDREVPAGYVEASRGCAHRCRHCPVPVVYDGRVRTVPVDDVLADVDAQVAAGAGHVTFGDPDFLNSPPHADRVVRALSGRHPGLTFDVTVKVEHVLAHPEVWGRWADAGLLFVVSAFESASDDILLRLDKGHTAAEAAEAARLLRDAGVHVRPSLLPFTPWATLADVVALFDFVVDHGLLAAVDPVQLTIRLLVPPGSLVLSDPEAAALAGPYDPALPGHPWASPHPGMDALQQEMSGRVEAGGAAEAVLADLHAMVDRWARRVGVRPPRPLGGVAPAEGVPRLTESWFCCAEPTSRQLSAGAAAGPGGGIPGR